MSTYRAGEVISKSNTRKMIVTALKRHNLKEIRAITFPADKFHLEKRLLLNYSDCLFHTIERDEEVYNEQVLYIFFKQLKNSFDLNLGEAKKVYKQLALRSLCKFNFIWLDVCGFFQPWIYYNTKLLMSKKRFEKNGIFAFTIRNGREGRTTQKQIQLLRKESLGSTNDLNLDFFKRYEITAIFYRLFKAHGYNCTVVKPHYYKTTKKGSDMIMYLFHLTKPLK